jgi:GxxExxY protein
MLVAWRQRQIPNESPKPVDVVLEGVTVGTHRMDLVADKAVAVERKAVKAVEDIRFAPLRSNLKASGLRGGRLLNFSVPTLVAGRVVLS